ncbi:MAG: molybdopterin molybdotransferase MoeA [Bacteroidia bacterium]|nr:molybdopterin molybdotransferase MoeA [Bacteroidia bacterium]
MISVLEAKKILSKNSNPLTKETILLAQALGKIIAADIVSPIDVPSFNNSAMDGYAFCFQEEKTNYPISAQIQAGDKTNFFLKAGNAARIFTGAPMPIGADTVAQQESVIVKNNTVFFNLDSIRKGQHVRLQGTQCKVGETIIKAGTKITPGVVALLSSVGIYQASVYSCPKVKIIVTGNELINPGTPLQAGEIYNSNQPALVAYLTTLGISNVQTAHIKDNLEELINEVRISFTQCDVLILSGGISVGEYDFVYKALMTEGVQPLFYKIKQKPGKPLFVGKKEDKLIFALPGNPAAAITCFNQYVKPTLQRLMGEADAFLYSAKLPLTHHWEKKGTLANILKAQVSNGEVTILNGQDSFNLLPFSLVNAFVLLYEEDIVKSKNDLVEVYYW